MNTKFGDLAAVVVGGVLVYAAVQKAVSLPMFAFVLHEVIQSGTWLSSSALIGLALVIVLLESFLGFSLIFRFQPARVLPAALLLMTFFTLVLVMLLLREDPVRCGCLGMPIGVVGTKSELILGVIRNVIMFVLLCSTLRASRASSVPAPSMVMPKARPSQSRGFTLVELLVSVGVIAIVVSLSLPALKNARNSGIVATSLSGHRHVYSYLDMFTNDHAGQLPFPYIRREGDYAHPVYSASDRPLEGYAPAPMALQARIWASLFQDQGPEIQSLVYQGRWSSIVGRDVPEGLLGGSFVLSSTMFALPEFFTSNPDQAQLNQFRPTKVSLVTYPSSKVFAEDLESWGRVSDIDSEERSATFGFADGSADAMTVSQFQGEWVPRAAAWMSGPGHTTLDGLSGRDR